MRPLHVLLIALLCLAATAACRAEVPVDYLALSRQDAALLGAGRGAAGTITLEKIRGEATGVPFSGPKVEDAEFRQAIAQSLSLAGLRDTTATAKYALRAIIVDADMPFFQFGNELQATYAVQYDLFDLKSGRNVFSRRIVTTYRLDRASVKPSADRGRLLVGGAIRENLKRLVADLRTLDL